MSKKYWLMVAAIASCVLGYGAVALEADDGNWELVWSDEFNGDEIDFTKWSHEVDCWGGGNEERQCYTKRPENSFVADGYLNIVARYETASGPALPRKMREGLSVEERRAKKEQPFTSARLNTKGKADWTYGRFEVRAKMPRGQGMWPAIWMLPTEEKYGAWAASGEIDIAEVVNLGAKCEKCEGGLENSVVGTVHYGGEWPRNKYKGDETELPPSDEGFHVYSVEWREGSISWFVDGMHYSTLTSKDWGPQAMFTKLPPNSPFDQPFHMILNVAIGGHLPEAENEGGVSLLGFPKAMQVDWVRVYKKSAHDSGDL
ncbi:glycoside hydrolase family 16 protein [Parvularcula sp. IMCC14364]|uniref:glycoside hydrolase family 16 protein n=1 Tax=Parvularcula sp. IMCC14364 TaxID=3067902 RepID=UPI002740F835|nr:glycoside hydrolase family 16 protein [Parvularcula sp. IMCC14364]